MKITYYQLRNRGACYGNLDTFKDLFGDEVEVTVALAAEHANKFDWNWAAEFLLSPEGHRSYAAFEQVAYARYECRIVEAREAAYRVHLDPEAPETQRFNELLTTEQKALQVKLAETFATLYVSENSTTS